MPADRVSGEGWLPGSQMATFFTFFCVLRWWKALGALEPSFIRALIPLTKAPPSCLLTSLRPCLPTPSP